MKCWMFGRTGHLTDLTYGWTKAMQDNDATNPKGEKNIMSGMYEYDEETVERVHQENIRKSKLALEADEQESASGSSSNQDKSFSGSSRAAKPRTVHDWEISDYQGFGGKKQMQKAQSRKRRQVRNNERSVWDNIAPKKMHGTLNLIYWLIFIIGMIVVAAVNGYL